MVKSIEKNKSKLKERGITLVALVITIIVLLILAGVTISSIFGDSGIIKNATEAQILSELANVKEALEIYKIANYSHGDMSNEELVEEGLLKEVFIKDTYRTVAVITNLKTIDIKSEFGKGGEKQENTEEDTLLDMYNVYGIDMADGTLYYIRDGVWSIEGEKVTYTASTGEEKLGYVVETINGQYLEDRKFITEWTVEAGTTITLPITQAPNITIEWGSDDDGDGEPDIETCTTAQPTHTYTEAGTYEIKIAGNIGNWVFGSVSTSKDYITGIKQWGSVSATSINFRDCINLAGSIPSANIENCFTNVTSFESFFNSCSNLTGNIPKGLFDSATNCTTFYGCFRNCTGLTGKIPDELFANKSKCTTVGHCFSGCTGLDSIPENLFKNSPNITDMGIAFFNMNQITEIPEKLLSNINNGENNKITTISGLFQGTSISTVPAGLFEKCTEITRIGNYGEGVFYNCKNLTSLPNGLFKNCTKIKETLYAFYGCSSLVSLPDDFTVPNATNIASMFNGCSSLKTLPEGFTIPSTATGIQQMFKGCSSLEELPENFRIPSTVAATSTRQMFYGCGSLKALPEGFTIPDCIKDLQETFTHCSSLESLPEGFSISNTATNITLMFNGCSSLKSIPDTFVIPNTITDIMGLFYQCNSLETIPENFVIPESVTNGGGLQYGAFAGCYKLKGSMLVKAKITDSGFFKFSTATQSGGTLTVNYTENSKDTIDELIATGNTTYIKKGSLME